MLNMLFKEAVAVIALLSATVIAMPYHEWQQMQYGDIATNMAAHTAAAQPACTQFTGTRDGVAHIVRVCESQEGDPSKVCLSTRVSTCCPRPTDPDFSRAIVNAKETVKIAGEDVTVTFYLADQGLCYRVDDEHLRALGCSNPDPNCNPECKRGPDVCINNTRTGDASSCVDEVCECKTGYLPPDCCNCDTTAFYLPDCKPFCRRNCATFRPADVGGCFTCRDGFITAPECCDCEPGTEEINGICKCSVNINPDGTCKEGAKPADCCECDTAGNDTHAFYKTKSGECRPYCKKNCASVGSEGCNECKVGFISVPECCRCEPGRTEVNGVCKCSVNINSDGSCKEGTSGEDCCECDTAGNTTHAFYKTPSGECKPYCKRNCAVVGTMGCDTCKTGFITVPECCQCQPGRTEYNGVCKCDVNVNPDGSCKEGTSGEDCCECDTTGNNTHAFYKTLSGECKPYCKLNCLETGDMGCVSCKEGYITAPECCSCDVGFEETEDGECQRIPPSCSIDQNIYFLLDGTKGNNEFCSMAIIIQLLVAAFNPTASLSGTRVSTVLFPNGQSLNASVVFGTRDTCDSIVNNKIKVLQQEFQKCRSSSRNYNPLFPSFCGDGTSAVDGLKTIHDLIPSPPTTKSAVVILTDGQIIDDATERSNILAKLGERGVQSVLAAAVKGAGSLSATVDNLRLYTLQNREADAILRDTVIDVGVGIVARMNKTGIICPDHAANVTNALRAAQNQPYLIDNFCRCHTVPPPSYGNLVCRVGYPECGGPLSISYEYASSQRESVNLEEEILAAVETVLKNFEG